MNIMVSLWGSFLGALGALMAIYTFFGLKTLFAHRTPPIPTAMAVMGAIIVAILYFMLVWYITHIKVYRVLCYKKSFWGIVPCRGHPYWRIGIGRGFFEFWGSRICLYLPREDAQEGKPTL